MTKEGLEESGGQERVESREAREVGDPAEVAGGLKMAGELLSAIYGVDNLTTIEGVHLRHLIERFSIQRKKEEELSKQGEITREMAIDSAVTEAIFEWLRELYGVRRDDIVFQCMVVDYTDGEQYKFVAGWKYAEEQARAKKDELRAKGHEVGLIAEVTEEFKEYLRRLREKSQQP